MIDDPRVLLYSERRADDELMIPKTMGCPDEYIAIPSSPSLIVVIEIATAAGAIQTH
jgi:hypothetical protein